MSPHRLYLLIGGNMGDRAALLREAVAMIGQRIGQVAEHSQLYETEPWGDFAEESPQPFLNQALLTLTPLPPYEALDAALEIEAYLGRKRGSGGGYASRPIDIDLIFYDQLVLDTPRLTLPHPRMHLRRFVLQPLCDIAPELIHPVLNKTISQLLAECTDPLSSKEVPLL